MRARIVNEGDGGRERRKWEQPGSEDTRTNWHLQIDAIRCRRNGEKM